MGHKTGRNDPCWCGSGKKFKFCHWPDEETVVNDRNSYGPFGLNPIIKSLNPAETGKDISQLLKTINNQKSSGTRPHPSIRVISMGEVPSEKIRKTLLDICAQLVDENWAGRSEMCIYFAVLMRNALSKIGIDASVHIGEAKYISSDKSFTWDHAWVTYDDYIIDGNVDSMIENPMIPIGIDPDPYWGPINILPKDRNFKSNRILLPKNDTTELDKKEIRDWNHKLDRLLREAKIT